MRKNRIEERREKMKNNDDPGCSLKSVFWAIVIAIIVTVLLASILEGVF